MINSKQSFRLLFLFVLAVLLSNKTTAQSENDKLGYCWNPLSLWYQLTPGTPPAPPYTARWTVNGVLTRTATAVFGYSPLFPATSPSWHDSLTSIPYYPSLGGPYKVVVEFSNNTGYDVFYTWNVQYDSLTIVKTDAPASCTGPTQGSITVVPYGPTNINDYNIVMNPGNVTGTTFNNLPVGTYTITIDGTNTGGGFFIDRGTGYVDQGLAKCHSVITVTITQPQILSAIATNSKPGTCGLPNGEVSVNTTGGTGTKTYLWAPGGSTAQTVSNLVAGIYTVTVTDGMGCTSVSTATIANQGAITATMGPPVNVNCAGGNTGSATVTVGNGTANYNYSWSNSFSTNLPTTTNTVSSLTAGGYTVTVTDNNGCTATSSVTITEPAALNVPTPTTTTAFCGQNTGSVSVATPTGGTGPYSYSWTGGALTQTASNLAAGPYTVTVTDNNGCTATTSATITGTGSASVIITSFNAATCFGANNGNATASGSGGSGTFTYSWSSGQKTASVTGLAPGTYTVTLNSGGCLDSITVTINEPPDLVVSATGTTAPCGNATGQVSVNNPSGGTGAYTYIWSPGGAVSQTVNNLLARDYTVTVKDANGCSKTATTTVTDVPGPSITADPPTNVTCKGATTGSVSAAPVGGTSPYNFTWNTNPVQNASSATNLSAGTYIVTVSDANGCTATTSATITEPPKLNTSLPTPRTACIGQNVTLSTTASGGTPSYNYMWSPGGSISDTATVIPSTTTTYTVVVTDANGCSTSQTVTVTVNPPLNVTGTGATGLCVGDPATINALATGGNGGPYSYSWMPNNSTGATVSVTNPPAGSSDYTVTVTDGCGTPSATTIVTVTVNPPPVIQFSPDVTSGCSPLKVTFTNTTAAPLFCFWDFGDGSSSSVCNDSAHTYLSAGTYTVKLTVTDTNNCVNARADTALIRVSAPVADFSMSSTRVSIYEPSISFTDQSINASTWLWNFGDTVSTANSSIMKNPSHTYSDTGVYCIKLVVHDSTGCVDSTIKCLTIVPQYTFYVPNAFTPNGDSMNEIFNGKGSGIYTYKMLIFDRWGNLIFTTEDINNGWDGCVKGSSNPVQQDVYVYKIVVTDIFSLTHNYVGHVTVVR